MKRIITLFTLLFLITNSWAQSPEMMSYQAVIRNSSNQLVANTTISMRISILQGTSIGASVYTETQTPITNANGLVTIKIGTGTTSDDFSSIDWANGLYFIKTETDPAGGTSYSITGTSQLLSVPYALHSKTADAVLGLNDTLATKAVLLTGTQIIEGNKTFTSGVHPLYIEVNAFNTGNRSAFIDFHGDDTYTDYSLRLIRTNTGMSLLDHRGIGAMRIQASDSGSVQFATRGNVRMNIDATGNLWVNGQMIHDKTLRISESSSNKALFFRQDGDNSYISNKKNFLSSGTAKNGWLFINGDAGLSFRVGSESVAGTTVMSIDTLKNINMQNNQVINVKTPINNNDAVNKAYVDAKAPNLKIGDSYQGGIIFWLDATGQHGLIAATADQSTGIQWYSGTYTTTNAVRDGIGAGMYNTERIITNQSTGSYAAQLCANYLGGGYGDWYLPSKYELNLLFLQQTAVGGFASAFYWSSTEYGTNYAWMQYFANGFQGSGTKDYPYYVRAVRAF